MRKYYVWFIKYNNYILDKWINDKQIANDSC